MQSRLYCGVSNLIAVIVLFSSIHRSEAATFDVANGDVTSLVNTISLCQGSTIRMGIRSISLQTALTF